MNHPSPEEWMSYLYDEMNVSDRAALTKHLETCPECQARAAEYNAVRGRLEEWRFSLPKERPHVAVGRTAWGWAAAAAFALIAAFGLGRSSGSTSVRAEMQGEVREQVRTARFEMQHEFAQLLHRELDKAATATLDASEEQGRALLAKYDDILQSRRSEESEGLYAALKKIESQRTLEYLSLRKDLDTVALNTDAGLRHTQQQLVQLADYTRPESFSNPTPK
jgi:hypothetical protein